VAELNIFQAERRRSHLTLMQEQLLPGEDAAFVQQQELVKRHMEPEPAPLSLEDSLLTTAKEIGRAKNSLHWEVIDNIKGDSDGTPLITTKDEHDAWVGNRNIDWDEDKPRTQKYLMGRIRLHDAQVYSQRLEDQGVAAPVSQFVAEMTQMITSPEVLFGAATSIVAIPTAMALAALLPAAVGGGVSGPVFAALSSTAGQVGIGVAETVATTALIDAPITREAEDVEFTGADYLAAAIFGLGGELFGLAARKSVVKAARSVSETDLYKTAKTRFKLKADPEKGFTQEAVDAFEQFKDVIYKAQQLNVQEGASPENILKRAAMLEGVNLTDADIVNIKKYLDDLTPTEMEKIKQGVPLEKAQFDEPEAPRISESHAKLLEETNETQVQKSFVFDDHLLTKSDEWVDPKVRWPADAELPETKIHLVDDVDRAMFIIGDTMTDTPESFVDDFMGFLHTNKIIPTESQLVRDTVMDVAKVIAREIRQAAGVGDEVTPPQAIHKLIEALRSPRIDMTKPSKEFYGSAAAKATKVDPEAAAENVSINTMKQQNEETFALMDLDPEIQAAHKSLDDLAEEMMNHLDSPVCTSG